MFIALLVLRTQAQDYLIDFAASGDTNAVATVRVENLTSGAVANLNGTDVLHLVSTVGMSSLHAASGRLLLYPNPMAEEATLTLLDLDHGFAVIVIADLSGKIVLQTSMLLSAGVHAFRISGLKKGLYLVKITGEDNVCSAKLMSLGNGTNTPLLQHISPAVNPRVNRLKTAAATVVMPYTEGDQLLFKGSSGIYRTFVPDVPTSSKTVTFNFADCTDADSNHYAIVHIGSQTWMAENINVGTMINGSHQQNQSPYIEKYCYLNLVSHCIVYGGLYQWDELMQNAYTQGVKGICPDGWHIPSDAEWTAMTDHLGGSLVAGRLLKETGTAHWAWPNVVSTNSSGFTALGGGMRMPGGVWNAVYYEARFWTSTPYNNLWKFSRNLYYDKQKVVEDIRERDYGFSCRCVRD